MALLLVLTDIKDSALRQKVVEEILQETDGFALSFYVPYQEFVIKGGD